MTFDDATKFLEVLKQSASDRMENLRGVMESQFDYGDRAIAQIGQLKILNESEQSPVEIIQALREVAASGNPL